MNFFIEKPRKSHKSEEEENTKTKEKREIKKRKPKKGKQEAQLCFSLFVSTNVFTFQEARCTPEKHNCTGSTTMLKKKKQGSPSYLLT